MKNRLVAAKNKEGASEKDVGVTIKGDLCNDRNVLYLDYIKDYIV